MSVDRIARTLGLGVGDLMPQNSSDGSDDLNRLIRTLQLIASHAI